MLVTRILRIWNGLLSLVRVAGLFVAAGAQQGAHKILGDEEDLPPRYWPMAGCLIAIFLALFTWAGFGVGSFWFFFFVALFAIGIYDLLQKKNGFWRFYPLAGHLYDLLHHKYPVIKKYFPYSLVTGVRNTPHKNQGD